MNRKLIAAVVSGALVLPVAALAQDEEAMEVPEHSHPSVLEHEHELGEGEEMMAVPMHGHAYPQHPPEAHPHDALHGHSVTVSGHIARVISHVDGPGEAASGPKWSHGDLAASGSRFRMTASEELENGVTVGVNLEYGAGDGGASPSVRHSNLTFGGAFGSIAAGHTGPSTNGTNDDLSQSGLAIDMACSNANMASCPDFTAGRRGVIRYSTPAIGAIGISGSFAPDFWDGQLTTGGELGGGSYALRASFAVDGDDSAGASDNNMGKETYSVAAAIKVGGASVSTLFGSIDQDNGAMDEDGAPIVDSDGFGVKLAYDFGDSGIGLLFRQTDMDNGPEPSTWGIGVQHNMLGAVEVFAGYYVYDPDTTADETKTFSVGSRIKF
jgi:predicted porin